jgi:YVTN family beta-propeller protein
VSSCEIKAEKSNIATILVGELPTGIAYNPKNNYIYVADSGSNTVSVIDTRSNKQINPILVGELPTGIAYNPKNNYIYLTNSGSNTVSVINANSNKQFASIALQDALRPIALAYNSDNGYIYVVNEESSTISVINGTSNKQIETIILPNQTVTLQNGTKNTLQPRPISVTHNAANGGMISTSSEELKLTIPLYTTPSLAFCRFTPW